MQNSPRQKLGKKNKLNDLFEWKIFIDLIKSTLICGKVERILLIHIPPAFQINSKSNSNKLNWFILANRQIGEKDQIFNQLSIVSWLAEGLPKEMNTWFSPSWENFPSSFRKRCALSFFVKLILTQIKLTKRSKWGNYFKVKKDAQLIERGIAEKLKEFYSFISILLGIFKLVFN